MINYCMGKLNERINNPLNNQQIRVSLKIGKLNQITKSQSLTGY